MALYPKAVKRLITPGPNDPKITARLAILHVAVMIGSLYDYFKDRSGGIESHFYVFKNGTVEQYRDTAYQADANCDANDFAVSIETEGMAEGEWTPEQVAAIKDLLLWLHEVHDIPLAVPTRWDGSGVGYHILFMQEWAGGPRSCPGPDRIKQFKNVLVPWMAASGSEDDVTPDDITKAVIAAFNTDGLVASPIGGNPTVAPVTALRYAMEWSLAARNAAQLAADPSRLAGALVPLLPSGSVTQADLETALRNVLGSLDNKE